MQQIVFFTKQGFQKIADELAAKQNERPAIVSRLQTAREQGDLSENADYHKAKEDQAFLEGRIQELEHYLRTAVVIEEDLTPKEVVAVGTRVTVQETGADPEVFFVVGVKEADPSRGRISNESPIGRALMDHRVGDQVQVETPGGKIEFKILQIE